MKENVAERCKELGRYMVLHQCSIRQVAKAKEVSKSIVTEDLTQRLPKYDSKLYQKVRKQLDINRAERCQRARDAKDRNAGKRVEERCKELGRYMVLHQCSIRKVADEKNIARSIVYRDLTVLLPQYDPELYKQVRMLLDKNKAERCQRASAAIRKKQQK